jgi:uncharacterized membrane protein
MDLGLAVYLAMAAGVVAVVVGALRRPADRAWLRRIGWVWVLLMVASIVFGVFSRLA